MDARKLILTNGFTLRELLRLKTQYLSKKRIVYGRIQKVTEDESFDRFILLTSDLSSGAFFLVHGVVFFMFFGHFFDEGFNGGWILFFFFLGFILYDLFSRAKSTNLSILIIIKLMMLRLRMRWYKISPPQIMDD
ncbi:hypothetical protein [Erwinia sorbitola]|uniref:Uncharacterized protein n=1 Tax=Erwinia sorbitola TaxID=2681984 RepID=A0A6I6EI58_9GAMM|nr:hypothetical protein [Erwinia sorbitola]MTD28936.1 hypothetical protein [Erwinia sorbitola]QGU89414.1 hypothetical protein GN242_20390 [Erwinia sorbitola]